MLIILATLALSSAEAPAAQSVEGRWVNPSRSVIIDIAACAEALCGTVAWASTQAQQDAKRGVSNLIGTQLLTGLEPKGELWEGKLFVPDERLHATAKIEPQGSDQLKVFGCEIGICKSQVWSRSEGPLPAPE